MKKMLSVELLKQMRMFVGYSQQDLANATNYSRSYISKIEQGTVKASSIVHLHILQACRRAGMEDWQFAMLKIVVDGDEKDLEELLNGLNQKTEKG
ncbi:helix-turn-helix transcriptional regulator [Lysinibacillus fusiformis]